MKDKSIYGLDKIPDSFFLKEANVEIGKLKSYISELEYKIEQANEKIKLYESNEARLTVYQLTKALKKSNEANNRISNYNTQLAKQVFELTKKLDNV